jgi:cytidine deaminase
MASDLDGPLLNRATEARLHAADHISGFKVGAAIETSAGRIFTGCNIENISLGLTVCAERVALWKALSEGEREFKRIAVLSDAETPAPPCGACRQLLWEYCGDIPLLLYSLRGETRTIQLAELLPLPFDRRYFSTGKPD